MGATDVLDLKIDDRRWLLVFAGLVFFLAYMPPLDLAKKAGEWNNDCSLPLVLVPFFVSLFLVLWYFSRNWKKWVRYIFVLCLSLGILIYLLFDTFNCFRQFSDLQITESAVSSAVAESGHEQDNCACYLTGKSREVVKVKYIPMPVKTQPPVYTLRLYQYKPQINLPKDTIVYQIAFYKPPSYISSFLYPGLFYVITPEWRSALPMPFTRHIVNGIQYRINLFARALGQSFFNSSFDVFEEEQTTIGQEVLDAVNTFANLAYGQLYEDRNTLQAEGLEELVDINDFSAFASRVGQLHQQSLNRIGGGASVGIGKGMENIYVDTFSITEPYMDSIAILNYYIASLEAIEAQESGTESSGRELLRENGELNKTIFSQKLRLEGCNEQLKQLENDNGLLQEQIADLEGELKRLMSGKRDGLLIERSNDNRIREVQSSIVTYEFKGKKVLIEKNSTHRLKDIEGCSVAFDPRHLKDAGSDATLHILFDNVESYKKRVRCNGSPCTINIPDYAFSNNKSFKGGVKISLRGRSDRTLMEFEVE